MELWGLIVDFFFDRMKDLDYQLCVQFEIHSYIGM